MHVCVCACVTEPGSRPPHGHTYACMHACTHACTHASPRRPPRPCTLGRAATVLQSRPRPHPPRPRNRRRPPPPPPPPLPRPPLPRRPLPPLPPRSPPVDVYIDAYRFTTSRSVTEFPRMVQSLHVAENGPNCAALCSL